MHTVTADKQKRIRIPSVKPGQVFALEDSGNGRVVLTLVKKVHVKPDSPLTGLKPLSKKEAEQCWGRGVKHELDALEAHSASLPKPPPE